MDHDQRFKLLIQTFFVDFLQLFFSSWADRLDTESIVWLDKELFPDPPEGSRHQVDLLAQVRTRLHVANQPLEPTQWLAVVHVEIESPDRTTKLRPRLPYYYIYLRHKYNLPILPIVLYLNVGLDGIGIDVVEEQFWELTPFRFSYLYVGLPALDGLEYVQGDNWLGVALSALMRIPQDQIVWLGAQAMQKISQAPLNDQKKHLLSDCVKTYLPLNELQTIELEALLKTEPYQGAYQMNTTYYEQGWIKGKTEGILEGKTEGKTEGKIEGKIEGILETLSISLEAKFGDQGIQFAQELNSIRDLALLTRLLQTFRKAKTIDELRNVLRSE